MPDPKSHCDILSKFEFNVAVPKLTNSKKRTHDIAC